MKKLKVGILGATGMVGQRFIQLLSDHPWFDIIVLAASPASASKLYKDAVGKRWSMPSPIPQSIAKMKVLSVKDDMVTISKKVSVVFCALDLDKKEIQKIENTYASLGVAVISNNSAHRWTQDIPMIMPEINPDHVRLIDIQRKNRGWGKGLIAVKPNCSVQSYVSILTALKEFVPTKINVVSLQAISGAGKTFDTWPEMVDTVIPFISGEEEKSEKEPMKIWGKLHNKKIALSTKPKISATCIRIPVSHGHMAQVSVTFEHKPSQEEIFRALRNFKNPVAGLNLPSSPKRFIQYFEEENRPQTKLDRDRDHGMGISMGRLREGRQHNWEFIALSHNTIRGAAGGAILMAELLVKKGYISS